MEKSPKVTEHHLDYINYLRIKQSKQLTRNQNLKKNLFHLPNLLLRQSLSTSSISIPTLPAKFNWQEVSQPGDPPLTFRESMALINGQ
jgi:hypothetical protein